ncbi:MAG: acyltransferase family protein [Clostridium baratii]
MNKQNNCMDLSKFILSICIVSIHTKFLNGYIYPWVRIAVPIFFIFSSYLFFKKIENKSFEEQNNILKGFIIRNLKLYVCWFIILLPITLYVRKYFFNGIIQGIYDLFHDIFFGSTFLASWYIISSIIAVILIFYLSKVISNRIIFIISVPMYLLGCIATNYSFILLNPSLFTNLFSKIEIIFGVPSNNFMVALIWICIGKIISDNKKKLNSKKIIFIKLIISLLGLYLEYFILNNILESDANDCYLMLIPTAYFLVLLILNSNIRIKHCRELRKISTIVYCMHFSIAVVLDNLIDLIHIRNPYNVVTFLGTLACSWIISIIILRIEKKVHILRYTH